MRDNSDIRSRFCMKSKAEAALNEIVSNCNFSYIFLSYNTEGILSEGQIKEIFIRNCKKDSVELIKIPYRRYKRNKTCLLYTSPSPRDISGSRMPSSA